MRPRILDLFCGAGGAAMGYARAGFEVVGVDIGVQPNYPFRFIRGDALQFLRDEFPVLDICREVKAIHASPPCQLFSRMTPAHRREAYIDLLTPTRDMLERIGLPYVIENVEGARSVMREPFMLCGSSFGLRVRRHRLFETNWPMSWLMPCAHGQQGQPVGVYGEGSSKGQKRGRKADTEAEVLEVMGMPWSDRKGATQAIPPDYTEFIGQQLMGHLEQVVA